MAALVVAQHMPAGAVEIGSHLGIAADVFPQPVDDEHGAARRAIDQPAAQVQAQAVGRGEGIGRGKHGAQCKQRARTQRRAGPRAAVPASAVSQACGGTTDQYTRAPSAAAPTGSEPTRTAWLGSCEGSVAT